MCAHALDPGDNLPVYALYLGMISATSIASLPSGQYYARKVPQLRLVGGRFSRAERPAGIRSCPSKVHPATKGFIGTSIQQKQEGTKSKAHFRKGGLCALFTGISGGARWCPCVSVRRPATVGSRLATKKCDTRCARFFPANAAGTRPPLSLYPSPGSWVGQ